MKIIYLDKINEKPLREVILNKKLVLNHPFIIHEKEKTNLGIYLEQRVRYTLLFRKINKK